MVRRKPEVDKTIRPEYVPVTIWKEYQECKGESEMQSAFERLIFGDGINNSQRAMQRTWMAIENSRLSRWNDFLKKSDDKLLFKGESYDKGGKYGALSWQLKHLVHIGKDDFSKYRTPTQEAEQLREISMAGRKFLSLLDAYYQAETDSFLELSHEEIDTLISNILNENKIKQLFQDMQWNIADWVNDYFGTSEFEEKAEMRQRIIAEYEQAVKNDLIPLVIKYIPMKLPTSLNVQIGRALDGVEFEAVLIKEDSCILQKVNIRNPKQTYMVRYLSDCFYTLFRENELISPIGRIVGAILCKEITREDVKDALRGYPRYGIRKAFGGELEDSGEDAVHRGNAGENC
jgi:hypothetical protein